MPVASHFTADRAEAQPVAGRPVDTRKVERAVAVNLIRNFLTALEGEGGSASPFMEYAQRRAEWQLEQWGEPLREGGVA